MASAAAFITLGAAVLVLANCATVTPMDRSRTPEKDWPVLLERTVIVRPKYLPGLCKGTVFEPGGEPRGCAVIRFALRQCTIYAVQDRPDIIAHEREHCLGYDHVGESALHDAWQNWKAAHEPVR